MCTSRTEYVVIYAAVVSCNVHRSLIVLYCLLVFLSVPIKNFLYHVDSFCKRLKFFVQSTAMKILYVEREFMVNDVAPAREVINFIRRWTWNFCSNINIVARSFDRSLNVPTPMETVVYIIRGAIQRKLQ